VILLAVVVALLVMAIVPAVALAASDSMSVADGQTWVNSQTVKVTYSSASSTANLVDFEVRGRHSVTGNWSDWYDIAAPGDPVYTQYSYANGTVATRNLRLIDGALFQPNGDPLPPDFWESGDQFQIRVNFSAIPGPVYIGTIASQTVTLVFEGPPISTLAFDSWSHIGRSGIQWTNGNGHDHVLQGYFGQVWGASMGITHWILTKNSDAPVVQSPLTWSPWGQPNGYPGPVVIAAEPAWNQPKYANDGQYQIQHWAVDAYGQRQVTDSYDTIGYDTKHPYVIWTWPATTTGYYNSGTIAISGDVVDDGGSGVAGYFADPHSQWTAFAPEAHVYWRSAETHWDWVLWENNPLSGTNQRQPTVMIDAYDHYRWHISGSIWVKPYYNAEYAVFVTGSDYAGNGGFPYEDWGIPVAPTAAKTAKAAAPIGDFIGIGMPTSSVIVDNMAPSTIVSSVDPAGTANTAPGYANWTNKDVTLTFTASDAGGSGIGSGVDYTEYIVGNSTTTPPALTASGTKGTTVTIKDTAPVGPVYVWFRSVDKAGNREAWNLEWVWLDNKAPILTTSYTGLWYKSDFEFTLGAIDNNSHLATPGIEWRVPTWPIPWALPHTAPMLPQTWTPLSQNPGIVQIPVDAYPNSRTDGAWPFEYRATDQAGNSASVTTMTVKIDTRPPTTAGASTFGDAKWVNGTKAYNLTATDQATGSGVKVTWYRVDNTMPWQANVNATPSTTYDTGVTFTGATQGAVHTIDFFSIDNATTMAAVADPKNNPYPGNVELGVVTGWAPIPLHPYINITSVTGYKTTTVKLDVTAPTVTAMDPKNGNWQKPLATVNFSGTDVGAGYNHTEWSTDGGTTWTSGEQAQVGGDGVITITYHGVDNVGIVSANQTIDVKVASTPPTVTAESSSAKSGGKISITFNITAVTPQATAIIQIRTLSGKTLSTHNYANVATGSDQTRTFSVSPKLKPGKYNIRVGAQDMAGNVQTKRGSATLTVTK